MHIKRLVWQALFLAGALTAFALAPAAAQGKSKEHDVTPTKAIEVTRAVLTGEGYEVVRIADDEVENAQVVYYRRGNMGKGKGKGPVARMVIHRVESKAVTLEAAPEWFLSRFVASLGLPSP